MTDTEFSQFVRSLLNEANAKFWEDYEITLYKKVGITLVNAQLWNLLMPLRKKVSLLTVTIADHFIPLPADCQKIVRIEYAETGDKLTYVQDEWFYKWANQSPGNPNGWTLSEGKLYVFPEPSATLTDYLRLWCLPRAATLADLPEELHPLIAVEAIISGRTKDENVTGSLEALRQRYYMAAVKALIVHQVQDPEIDAGVSHFDEDTQDY